VKVATTFVEFIVECEVTSERQYHEAEQQKITVVIGKEREHFGRYAVGSHVRNETIFWFQHYIESVGVLVRVLQIVHSTSGYP